MMSRFLSRSFCFLGMISQAQAPSSLPPGHWPLSPSLQPAQEILRVLHVAPSLCPLLGMLFLRLQPAGPPLQMLRLAPPPAW